MALAASGSKTAQFACDDSACQRARVSSMPRRQVCGDVPDFWAVPKVRNKKNKNRGVAQVAEPGGEEDSGETPPRKCKTRRGLWGALAAIGAAGHSSGCQVVLTPRRSRPVSRFCRAQRTSQPEAPYGGPVTFAPVEAPPGEGHCPCWLAGGQNDGRISGDSQ
jgi:hypothetical protein